MRILFFILKYGTSRLSLINKISEAHRKQRRMLILVNGAARIPNEIPGATIPKVLIHADYIPHLPHYSKYGGKVIIEVTK